MKCQSQERQWFQLWNNAERLPRDWAGKFGISSDLLYRRPLQRRWDHPWTDSPRRCAAEDSWFPAASTQRDPRWCSARMAPSDRSSARGRSASPCRSRWDRISANGMSLSHSCPRDSTEIDSRTKEMGNASYWSGFIEAELLERARIGVPLQLPGGKILPAVGRVQLRLLRFCHGAHCTLRAPSPFYRLPLRLLCSSFSLHPKNTGGSWFPVRTAPSDRFYGDGPVRTGFSEVQFTLPGPVRPGPDKASNELRFLIGQALLAGNGGWGDGRSLDCGGSVSIAHQVATLVVGEASASHWLETVPRSQSCPSFFLHWFYDLALWFGCTITFWKLFYGAIGMFTIPE